MEPIKVYVVKTGFEHEGLAYAEGEKYELADSVAEAMPEGALEVLVPKTPVEPVAEETEAPEAIPAKPWAGSHTVGRE